MRGYKVLLKGLTNRYGFKYEVGKTYHLRGDLKWKENGFHFCKNPEDTLRYVDAFNEEIEFCEVEGSGKIVEYEDEYYGFYDMYASSIIELLRVVPREEIFNIVLNSHSDRVKRYVTLIKLTPDEKKEILKK